MLLNPLLRKFILVFFSTAVFLLLIALYFGIANIFTAFVVYLLFFLFISYVIKHFYKNWSKTNYNITFWTVFSCIMLLELSLRYITKSHLSYLEANGRLNYYCPFDGYKFENFAKRHYYKINDIRLFNSIPNHIKVYDKPEFTYEHTYNSMGFREKEIASNTIDTSFTIIGLGDSFTEGVGVPYDSTWISLLGKKIRKSKNKALTINSGISGSDIVFESYKLKNLLLDSLKPQIVILAINSTDILDLIMRGGHERFVSKNKLKYKPAPWWRYAYSFSHISRFIIHKVSKIKPNYYTEKDYLIAEQDAKKIIKNEIINELIPLSKKRNFDIIFLFLPLEHEVKNKDFPLNDIYSSVSKIDSTVTINLYEILIKDSINFSELFWPIDMHNNSNGHLHIANVVYEHLTLHHKISQQ